MIDIQTLSQITQHIGVDIDSPSTYDLLFSYLKAKKLFPNTRITVSVSPSGSGFHLIIHKKVSVLENIYYRIMLHDDPWRIILSLKKLFLNPQEEYFDIIFDSKWGNESKRIDLEGILSKHVDDVKYIYDNWGSNKALRRLVELAEKIDGRIPKAKSWLTIFNFNGEDTKEMINKICEDTRKKDNSFKYKIYQSYMPYSQYVLVVSSPSKEKAYARGKWLTMVFSKEGIIDKIVKFEMKDKTAFFYVKQKS